ncbi:MAG: CPBP family intramembrane metalloprotease [Candidatus Hodarchaeaceae archaeon]|nr:CPBP family intramembrane metalloprotease [Candidatus Hodarchaeaceae archaeon]
MPMKIKLTRTLLLKAFLAQVVLFITLALAIAWWRGWLKDLGLNLQNPTFGVAAGLIVGAAMGAASIACDEVGLKNPLADEISRTLTLSDILFVNLVLIAPSEEIFFRGLLIPRIGLAPSAITFGLAHVVGYRALSEVVVATVFGLALGWLFLSSGSLLGPWLAHALANVVAMEHIHRRAGKGPKRSSARAG